MPMRQGGSTLKNASTWLPNDDFLGRIDPVNLKHVLGDIQTDRGNLHLDGSPHVIRLRRSLYVTSMPGAGAVHHIKGEHADTTDAVGGALEHLCSGAGAQGLGSGHRRLARGFGS